MTHFDVIKNVNKEDMAKILAALVIGLCGDGGISYHEVLGMMIEFLGTEVGA